MLLQRTRMREQDVERCMRLRLRRKELLRERLQPTEDTAELKVNAQVRNFIGDWTDSASTAETKLLTEDIRQCVVDIRQYVADEHWINLPSIAVTDLGTQLHPRAAFKSGATLGQDVRSRAPAELLPFRWC